nr:zinc finger, CCHC-type, retrotransposon Gag domain protein [Tanacetum cinerariifolium]
MVNTHHGKALKALFSKGADSSTNDVDNERNENESSSDYVDPNFGGFTEEAMKVVQNELEEFRDGRMINDSKNKMETYRDFMACDVPKFDGTLDPIACTKWNEKLKVEKFQRMLRDDIREVVSPLKGITLDDLLSRAQVREADLLRKKNKETKRKIDFVDRDGKKPKQDQS